MPILDIFGRLAKPRKLVVCTGPCCDGQGKATAHLDELRRMLSARSMREDLVEKGSCIRRSCLGKCTDEPLACVEPENVWYRGLTPEVLLRIYDEHVLEGRPLPEFILVEDV